MATARQVSGRLSGGLIRRSGQLRVVVVVDDLVERGGDALHDLDAAGDMDVAQPSQPRYTPSRCSV